MAERVKVSGERPPRSESPPRATKSAKASSTATPPKVSPLRGDDKKLRDALVKFYAGMGMGAQAIASMRGDVGLVMAGANIVTNAEATADAWIELAQQNPRVRAMLEGFVQGSSVATLVASHVTMVVPVLAARGLVPGEIGMMMLSDEARTIGQQYADRMRQAANNGTPTE